MSATEWLASLLVAVAAASCIGLLGNRISLGVKRREQNRRNEQHARAMQARVEREKKQRAASLEKVGKE